MPENVTGFQPHGNIKKALIDLTYFDMLPRRSPTFFREEPKKHSQTASQAAMGDPAGRQRGLCRQHGRRTGGLSEAARSAASARVPRRNLEAADHRDARADPREAGAQGASRLRIR